MPRPVHPCGRREHFFLGIGFRFPTGSSLRAQGTQLFCVGYGEFDRFIPAGAGNTCFCLGGRVVVSVHPCGRREHHTNGVARREPSGSSLRAQGTLPDRLGQLQAQRFIPAGAGNTVWVPEFVFEQAGSSLRAQGTLVLTCVRKDIQRFIPAGAGNTEDNPDIPTIDPVHPCGRREHPKKIHH